MKAIADWFIHGSIDWEEWEEHARKWGGLVAGVLFGIAWWCWADAVVSQHFVEGESAVPFKYNWPGILATLALILINMVSKDDLQEIAESGDDEANMRARLWLLLSFLLAFGSVAWSISVLVACSQAEKFVAVGVGSVMQCGFILGSSLILWAFRTPV